MVRVAVTGASGFIGQHILKRLHEHASDLIDEIVAVDRLSSSDPTFLEYQHTIPTRHVQCDLAETQPTRSALEGVDAVIHAAARRMDYLGPSDDDRLVEAYARDNVGATENVVEAMLTLGIPNLVFIGDAYANLPIEDNFGLSEDNHPGVPSSFLLGDYGESRIRAELFARSSVGRALPNNAGKLHGVFLRPVFVYGEGDYVFPTALKTAANANGGRLNIVGGPSSGMFQYIYAGNLAAMVESSLRLLQINPGRIDGEYIYCMESTVARHIYDFFAPVARTLGVQFGASTHPILARITMAWAALAERMGLSRPTSSDFTALARRFLLLFAYGFANRKQQIILPTDFDVTPDEAMSRTTSWLETELRNCAATIAGGKTDPRVIRLRG